MTSLLDKSLSKPKPSLPYKLPGGKIALPNTATYLRTLAGAALYMGVPAQMIRWLGRRGERRAMWNTLRWLARRMRHHLDIRLEIKGLNLIDPLEQYVVTPLHEGFADFLGLVELPLQMRFVARDELFHEWDWLGPFLRDTGQVEICPERGVSSYRQLLRQAGKVFENGESLVIFPQGSILGIEIDFTAGAFALARHFKRPILPVVLTGSHRVWEYPFSPQLRYGQHMNMHILPPISVEEVLRRKPEELRLETQKRMKATAFSTNIAAPRRFIPERDGYWDGYAFRIDREFPELAADIQIHQTTKNKII
ncbi:MAG: 1-acyl-sn-glycerol-3-phosphate acyltransferase [Chloroflexi bacterium]|uniref:1-acyl-sn-glycerol-3-phosphate acyltransferase n=1 Tax=Candidatus Chlorohelix allophototropha TaxID=3003348 RepID=A0A8T7M5L7_9CHLR|nr:1-acyl-sn-glycerol-3-phosphate acyltransferase [Chloroflexota bacterium]WJW69276.1 1-acyl-sn-glycerol-3-phosphate acyltransferase [Chloroflexota bacterium L227-S17]